MTRDRHVDSLRAFVAASHPTPHVGARRRDGVKNSLAGELTKAEATGATVRDSQERCSRPVQSAGHEPSLHFLH